MRRIVYRISARRHFNEIYWRIAESSQSAVVAERFTKKLHNACTRLARRPGMLGRPRSELIARLRSYPIGNYVIFFRYIDNSVEIIAVLERHRDIADYFGTTE